MSTKATEGKNANDAAKLEGAAKMKQDCGTASPDDCATHQFDGKVVSVTGDKLLMKNQEGKECAHSLAKDAKLTCDGVACKATDLKAGTRIRVTTKQDDRNMATGVEAIVKKTEFAQCG